MRLLARYVMFYLKFVLLYFWEEFEFGRLLSSEKNCPAFGRDYTFARGLLVINFTIAEWVINWSECLDFEVPKSSIMKAHNFMWQGCLFFHYYLATSTSDWAQIFTGLLYCALLLRCAKSEKTGLWQLPKVSSVFNEKQILNIDSDAFMGPDYFLQWFKVPQLL